MLDALRSRFGKSFWCITDEMVKAIDNSKEVGEESEFTTNLNDSLKQFSEPYRKHPDFPLFLLMFYSAGSGYRRKTIGEYFIECVKNSKVMDMNNLVGLLNFSKGVDRVSDISKEPQPSITIKEEPIEIDNVNYRSKKQIQCFYCRKYGQKNLLQKDCFKFKRDQQSKSNVSSVFELVSEGNLVDVTINDRIVHALVDTGAAVSIISVASVEKLNLKARVKMSDRHLTVASGEPLSIKGMIKIRLVVGGKRVVWNFICADIVHELILGLDFIMKNFSSINIGKDGLHINNFNENKHIRNV